jgi:hypothetical protein
MSEDSTTAQALNAAGVTEVRFERDADGNWTNAEPITDPEVIVFGNGPTLKNGQSITITHQVTWD